MDKSLKFAPIKNLNTFDTYINIQKYVRTLNIKKYFLSKPIVRPTPNIVEPSTHLRNRSTFNPLTTGNKFVDLFKNMVVNDLEKFKKNMTQNILERG